MTQALYNDLTSRKPSDRAIQTLVEVIEVMNPDETEVQIKRIDAELDSDYLTVVIDSEVNEGFSCYKVQRGVVGVPKSIILSKDPLLAAQAFALEREVKKLNKEAEEQLAKYNRMVQSAQDKAAELLVMKKRLEQK